MDIGDTDFIAIGGGIAGLVAANRAAELGLRTLVLEQGAAAKYPCNTRMTGGAFHIAYRDVSTGEERLREGIGAASRGYSRPERTDPLARDGGRALKWLQDQGVRFVRGGPWEYYRWVLAPPRPLQAGPQWEGRGGDVLLGTLEKRLMARGGTLVRAARVHELLVQDGCCTGVRATIEGRTQTIAAPTVVIADGGFQSNPTLLAKYISPGAVKLIQRGGATGMGDGLEMAVAAGADLIDVDRFYGHLLALEARENPNLSPFPFFDVVAASGVVVGSDGRRVADEGMGGIFMANQIAQLPDPASTIVIFDAAIWAHAGKEQAVPPNPHFTNAGGHIEEAGDIAGLVARLNLPAEALAATIAEHNRRVAAADFSAAQPPRTTTRYTPLPIGTAPFMAVRLCPGITYTTGGIRIDAESHVLRPDGTVIAGLMAAGAATGGLEGGPRSVYIGGLAMSTVTGLRAAEAAAKTRAAA